MLNQEKIGKFIAEQRRNQNMTQKQMAEQLGVSDKAVSKWETGKSMPDNSLLMELCTLLEINVNELLSGEKLSEDNYQGKAEENMTNLMEERETVKKERKQFVIGIVGFIATLFLLIFLSAGRTGWYTDISSLYMIVGVVLFVAYASGYGFDFLRAFSICFSKKDEKKKQLERSFEACIFVMVTIFITGLLVTLIGIISLLHHSLGGADIAVNMSIALISMLYACVMEVAILPFVARLQKMRHTDKQ